MIRILTIHHETDIFLELQKKYIERFTSDEYVVYCGFTKFTQPTLGDEYKMIDLNKESITHANRLNHMTDIAMSDCDDSDILIMMDSDTFPISENWVNIIKNNLKENPITAIQRKENSAAGMKCIPELHPHICFLGTTVKFWSGNKLRIANEPNTGYNIGEWLKQNELDFTKILRSNAIDLHPLYFGVYDDILYHHGSGNRVPYDGVDVCNRPRLGCGPEMDLVFPNILKFNEKLSELVINEIKSDNNFIRNFLMGVR